MCSVKHTFDNESGQLPNDQKGFPVRPWGPWFSHLLHSLCGGCQWLWSQSYVLNCGLQDTNRKKQGQQREAKEESKVNQSLSVFLSHPQLQKLVYSSLKSLQNHKILISRLLLSWSVGFFLQCFVLCRVYCKVIISKVYYLFDKWMIKSKFVGCYPRIGLYVFAAPGLILWLETVIKRDKNHF